MNRAIARRTAFESRRDVRMFLALLANAVHEGRIEVHAYAILATHFHLLVRSLDGQLSETMRRIENAYVRWFNRTRRRDGPLFRGRFRSIPVESVRYLHVLFRYIDQNAVEARLVRDPLTFPHGSAASQSGSARRRPWLCRSLVDRFLGIQTESGYDRVDVYRRAFPLRLTPALKRFVDRRIAGVAREPDRLDDLVSTTTAQVRAWMERKARLADGTLPGMPMATPEAVIAIIDAHRRRMPNARLAIGPRTERSVWDVALVALLRDIAGDTYAAIARRTRTTTTDVWRRHAEHRSAVEAHDGYVIVLTDLAKIILEKDHDLSVVNPRLLAALALELSSN